MPDNTMVRVSTWLAFAPWLITCTDRGIPDLQTVAAELYGDIQRWAQRVLNVTMAKSKTK